MSKAINQSIYNEVRRKLNRIEQHGVVHADVVSIIYYLTALAGNAAGVGTVEDPTDIIRPHRFAELPIGATFISFPTTYRCLRDARFKAPYTLFKKVSQNDALRVSNGMSTTWLADMEVIHVEI